MCWSQRGENIRSCQGLQGWAESKETVSIKLFKLGRYLVLTLTRTKVSASNHQSYVTLGWHGCGGNAVAVPDVSPGRIFQSGYQSKQNDAALIHQSMDF